MQLTHLGLLQHLYLRHLRRHLLRLTGLQAQETSLSLLEMILKSSPSHRCFQWFADNNSIHESLD